MTALSLQSSGCEKCVLGSSRRSQKLSTYGNYGTWHCTGSVRWGSHLNELRSRRHVCTPLANQAFLFPLNLSLFFTRKWSFVGRWIFMQIFLDLILNMYGKISLVFFVSFVIDSSAFIPGTPEAPPPLRGHCAEEDLPECQVDGGSYHCMNRNPMAAHPRISWPRCGKNVVLYMTHDSLTRELLLGLSPIKARNLQESCLLSQSF
jgi:hypothetical protein